MTRHLAPEQFVDLLEGHAAESALPHLQQCGACRTQLADLRATWEATSSVEIPEPSPLFWDHLSARVRDAVSAEQGHHTSRWSLRSWRGGSVLAAGAAALALVIAVGVRQGDRPPQSPASPQTVALAGRVQGDAPFAIEDDEPLSLVADLASELDWETTEELGFTPHGGAERVVADMTDAERAELQRLLTEALGGGV